MKTLKRLALISSFTFFTLQCPVSLSAQSVPKEDLRVAITTSSAKEIVKLIAPEVELNLEGNKINCNQSKALGHLRSFFQKYPISSFEFVHEGKSPDGQKFLIGQYKSNQKKFRVHILLEAQSNRYQVKVLSFY